MQYLNTYMLDGANHQARAVLAFLQRSDGIEVSWDDKYHDYRAKPKVARWENCREQGYIVSMNSRNYNKQLNVAFFEHRNSDSICAIRWEQSSMNSITIETAKFGDAYKDKYDTSFSVEYGKALEMARWIEGQLVEFWIETEKENK